MEGTCCACQEAEAKTTRLCGHKFCIDCDFLIGRECRMSLCEKLAELNAKGFPSPKMALLEQEAHYANLVRLEIVIAKELEDFVKKQERELNEFLNTQAKARECHQKEVGKKLDEAELKLKTAEYRTDLSSAQMDPTLGTLPPLYYKASELDSVDGEGRTWNLYERGAIEFNDGVGSRKTGVRYGPRRKVSKVAILTGSRFPHPNYSTAPLSGPPPSEGWYVPPRGLIIGVSETRVLFKTVLGADVHLLLGLNEADNLVTSSGCASSRGEDTWPAKIGELPWKGMKGVDRYKFDGISCSFPDGVRVYLDDPSICLIQDPVRSAPKILFHEICVQTPSGIRYLQVPRAP